MLHMHINAVVRKDMRIQVYFIFRAKNIMDFDNVVNNVNIDEETGLEGDIRGYGQSKEREMALTIYRL
jgi:hypothetical protein